MSSLKTPSGLPEPSTADDAVLLPASNSAGADSVLLAQIPDLDAPANGHALQGHSDGPADGRILSQGISNKLVMGVGFVLVLLAILPFIFGKREQAKPIVGELPAWHSDVQTVSNSTAAIPAGNSSATVVTPRPSVVPASAPAYLSPQPPTYRQNDRPAERDPRNFQADARNDPARQFNNGLRNDDPWSSNPQGNPLIPPTGTPAAVPAPQYQDLQVSEPGVARLDGTIAKPIIRTDYDRAGSSNH